MRKRLTRMNDEERSDRRKKMAMSIVLLLILIFSSFAYAIVYFFGDANTSTRYNGHRIRVVANDQGLPVGYTTKVDGKDISFYTPPQDTASITLPPGFMDTLQQANGVVFLFDPADPNTQLYDELRFDLSTALPLQQGGGILAPSDKYALPVLNCSQATPQYPFIVLRNGTRDFSYENGCYVMQGDVQGLVLLRDRIVYGYYDVIEE
jgi:hypothetical protein